jgi:predicted O-methyltransferase YrrM
MDYLRKRIRELKGLTDYALRDHRKFYPWGFAMNGQTSRLEAVRQIIFAAGIDRIIETGTFRGTTTEWFAQFGLPVETVETDRRFFSFAKARLSRFSNTEAHLDSSVPFLIKTLSHADRRDRILFYLDAHWENSLPLREELQVIFANHTNSIVVIDDFNVRDDTGYSYDNYGPDKALTLEYIENSNLPPYYAFYPATPAKQETGMKSGWIVLTPEPDIARILRTLAVLRGI